MYERGDDTAYIEREQVEVLKKINSSLSEKSGEVRAGGHPRFEDRPFVEAMLWIVGPEKCGLYGAEETGAREKGGP
jgi:hypothetical protein